MTSLGCRSRRCSPCQTHLDHRQIVVVGRLLATVSSGRDGVVRGSVNPRPTLPTWTEPRSESRWNWNHRILALHTRSCDRLSCHLRLDLPELDSAEQLG